MSSLSPLDIAESAVSEFAGSLKGDLIQPEDPGYHEARAIWNGMIDRRPALIAQCSGVTDVVSSVNFARTHQLLVSVRGGGHNVSGNAVCDGGLMIDLSQMTGIDVDPTDGTVRAEAGALLADLDRDTQAFGLAVPAGTVSETGIAGLTLGGGLGWLMRKHGLTCDNLISAEVVKADGSIVTASETENSDLLWGLRGGGGNFGIVTSFQYQAFPVGPTVLAGWVLHPMEQAADFFNFYAEFTREVPDELTTIGVLRILPPIASFPEELHGLRVAGASICYSGDLDAGKRLVQPLRDFGSPVIDTIAPKPFVDHQAISDAGVPAGFHYYEKSEFLPSLTGEMIETLVRHATQVISPNAFVGLFQLGGAVGRIGENATAYTHRDAAFSLIISAGWPNPDETENQVAWVRGFWNAMQPFSTGGAYVNFMSGDDGEDRIRDAYGETKYQRLVNLKTKYDPTNFFRLNQNINPLHTLR